VVPTLYMRKRFKQVYTLNLDLKELVFPFRFIHLRKDCRHTIQEGSRRTNFLVCPCFPSQKGAKGKLDCLLS
jgi:hypothetical protein